MKVTIEITEDGFTKTLEKGEEKFVQKWTKTSYGAETTEESVKWEDLGLSERFQDELESLNPYSLMNELENEAWTDHPEVKTKEGTILKKGDRFYAIGVMPKKGKMVYTPFMGKFPSDYDTIGDQDNIFKNFQNVKTECDRLNSKENNS